MRALAPAPLNTPARQCGAAADDRPDMLRTHQIGARLRKPHGSTLNDLRRRGNTKGCARSGWVPPAARAAWCALLVSDNKDYFAQVLSSSRIITKQMSVPTMTDDERQRLSDEKLRLQVEKLRMSTIGAAGGGRRRGDGAAAPAPPSLLHRSGGAPHMLVRSGLPAYIYPWLADIGGDAGIAVCFMLSASYGYLRERLLAHAQASCAVAPRCFPFAFVACLFA